MTKTYKATIEFTSTDTEDAPFQIEYKFDPPLTEALDPAPTAYQFATYLLEKSIFPVIAFNERYEAEMLDNKE